MDRSSIADQDDEPIFSSAEEGLEYWKNMAKRYKERLSVVHEELEEFQVNSHELEAELEAQLDQAESKGKELAAANYRLQIDVQALREKLEEQHCASHKQLTVLQDNLAQETCFKEQLQKYIRSLEQSNDDLERAKRAAVVSLEDFESRLNQAIERNVFLESELEERETLMFTVQRLKDEARDMRGELVVQTKRQEMVSTPTSTACQPPAALTPRPLDMAHGDHKPATDMAGVCQPDVVTPPVATPSRNNVPSLGGNTPLTPSARISALNIVGDLLRKVSALESKVASCKNFVNSQPRSSKASSIVSPNHSPRAKRLHWGSSKDSNMSSTPTTPSKMIAPAAECIKTTG